jgi:hypothetical protein
VGSRLIGALAEEKEALAGLRCPGSDVMGYTSNLIMLEGAHSLGVNGLGAEPKEMLCVKEVPASRLEIACRHSKYG